MPFRRIIVSDNEVMKSLRSELLISTRGALPNLLPEILIFFAPSKATAPIDGPGITVTVAAAVWTIPVLVAVMLIVKTDGNVPAVVLTVKTELPPAVTVFGEKLVITVEAEGVTVALRLIGH